MANFGLGLGLNNRLSGLPPELQQQIPPGILEDPQLLADYVNNRTQAERKNGVLTSGNTLGNGNLNQARAALVAALGLPSGVDEHTLNLYVATAIQQGQNSTNPETREQFNQLLRDFLASNPDLLAAVESAGGASGGSGQTA